MKAIYVTQHGGPEVLTYTDRPDPEPTEAHVLVEVLYAGVNYIDTYFRSGTYDQELPYIPGTEGCGRVIADPAGEIAEGTLVAWHSAPGSYAEKVCVPRNRLVAVPQSIDPAVAASMLLQGMTAHYLLHGTRETKPGDTMVITAGSGGVGLVLTQMAAAAGAVVYSVTSNEEKEKLAYEAGATQVFRYDNFAQEVRQANGGKGVDVIYDGVGKDTFAQALDVCRPRGLVCSFGSASGDVEPFVIQELNKHGSLFLTRPSIAAYVATDDEYRMRAQAVVRAVEEGALTFRIHEPYPLSDARLAHEELQARRTSGSVVLRVAADS
ncbi:quinone oxidoreductase family protein [Corynebacterium lipophiloflavum]|uniref:GroES-like protein n=1 Tax=Corynebacterium lipophiloflavum (strain ATCC 700352 / DSM 44291 / CCUG 37336 / JCM 10383 / DMMZ 1944) TaxID=525263 RepID=C0XSX5_CORLD|nr:quinone oxidoreductase [Corynebacterium lipophiloflavum]EEI16649.1 GroES-like protein [Corynebacterium lipophiloflavum DSM 44291]